MRRLVVASTALLAMLGAAVVAIYLVLLTGSADRAAGAVPADVAAYAQVYLQPSSGQKQSLVGLVGRLPGFRDAATLDEKIHQVAQRLLAGAGIDYEAEVRPWLGTEIALAAVPSGETGVSPHLLLLAAVRDPVAARSAVPKLMAVGAKAYAASSYRGVELMVGEGRSYALLDDLLIVADTAGRLRAAVDAETNAAPSLADTASFTAAMARLPVDRLASVYVDLGRVAPLGDGTIAGYRTVALALTAAADGLHLDGSAPFAAGAAGEDAKEAFALAGRASTLAAWMPPDTSAELVLFGLRQSVADLEVRLAKDPAFADATDALNQLRAIAALGLGINADRDVLPLFDGEAAISLGSARTTGDPRALLLLRPTDAKAATAALDRMRTGLAGRAASVSTSHAEGVVITSLAVPAIGHVAYAVSGGVVLIARESGDVAAALEAHASGASLASDPRYAGTFTLAGDHIGHEFWADVPALVDAAAGILDPGTELRDILSAIGQVALVASAGTNQLEIHAVLTVR